MHNYYCCFFIAFILHNTRLDKSIKPDFSIKAFDVLNVAFSFHSDWIQNWLTLADIDGNYHVTNT